MGRSRAGGSEKIGFEPPLWRAVAVFRIAALAYAAGLVIRNFTDYRSSTAAIAVLGVMIIWTAYTVYGYSRPALPARLVPRRSVLAVADLAVAVGCLLATGAVETTARMADGAPNVTVSWVAAPVMAWGVVGGRWSGVLGAGIVGAADIGLHLDHLSYGTFHGVVLLLLTGLVSGHIGVLARTAEAGLARAVELEAATRERERLARRIHDSVLQVLALVQRRGAEIGGDAAQLGRLAGEQETALRSLIGAAPVTRATGGAADVRELLTAYAKAKVTVSAPATPVMLPEHVARELVAAAGAALDNVARHCGDQVSVWVLLEEDDEGVVITVRDDGPGFSPGRLDEAAANGRLGVAQSIQGRLRDLGGSAAIISEPGEGTEVELRVPAG